MNIESLGAEMAVWRRDFHQHPELAFEEHRTSGRVAELLESFGLPVVRGLAKTGVVATLRCGSSTKAIALRADMDALPIDEQNELPYRSRHRGKMHACGHDGHTAMLLGAAKELARTRNFDGTVHFVFQPAEEKDGGGRVMVEEGLFERFPAERVFGMHNIPGLPVGRFALCAGPMMAAIDVVEYTISGGGGHAAFPHGAIDTVVVSAEAVLAMQTIVSRNVDPLHNAVVSITRVHGGDADNVIPDRVLHGGCVRTFLPAVQELVERRMGEILDGVTRAHGARYQLDYRRYYPATVNTAEQVEEAADAARRSGGEVDTRMTPVMGSEDFSFMLQARPGAFIFVGNGKGAGLHTPRYNFNDEILPWGARYWVTLVETQLAR